MSALLARLGATFIAPAADVREPPAPVSAAPAAERLGVLAPAAQVRAVGAAVALGAAGSGVALLATWCAEGWALALPALPAARRAASSLTDRGLVARASGRLVLVELPGDEQTAVMELRAAENLLPDLPCAFALGGPRGAAWDGELVESDRVLVSGPDPEVAALAAARLLEQGAVAEVFAAAAPSPLVAALAGAGLALPGLRTRVLEVVR